MSTCICGKNRKKNGQAKAARASETKHGQTYVGLLQMACARYSKATRNTWNIASLSVMILIIITPTMLRAVNAQSGILFQETLGNIESGTGVAVDSLGNIYVTGETTYLGPGNASVYKEVSLLKCDPTGTLVWQRIWSSNSSCDDSTSDIAVDSSGNIYVTGSTFWRDNETCMGNIFLVKFDSSGNLIWQKTYDSGSNDEGFGVSVDALGNIYVTGAIGGFGSGSWDVLLLKVDSSGYLLWQKTYGGISSDYGSDLDVDSSGYIYVTGSTSSFGSGMNDVFLLKVDSSGRLLWEKTWGPPKGLGCAYGNAVAVDSFGDIYVTGNFLNRAANDIFLLKFDSSDSFIWQRIWDGGDWDYAEDIAVDFSGGIYVGGYVMGFDVLLLRFDSSGNHIGQVTWGNNAALGASQKCFGVAVDSSGNPLLTGVVEMGPPYTFGYPNGTITESPFGIGVPSFIPNTPAFTLTNHSGVVQTPSGETATRKMGAFLVKFTPLGYTEDYFEIPAGVFGLEPMAFYGIVGCGVILVAALTATLLLRHKRRQAASIGMGAGEENITTLQSAMPAAQVERNKMGFLFSFIAGILIIISDLMLLLLQSYVFLVNPMFGTMGVVGLGCGIIVMVGAVLMRMPGKQTVGSILVILFSIISIYGLGGFFLGFMLGIAGGALGLTKPGRAGPGFVISLAGCSLSLLIDIFLLLSAITYRPSGFWGANLFAPSSIISPLIPGGASNPVTMGAIATISGIVALIGAILIYMPGKEAIGGILVVTFLLMSFLALGPPLGICNIVGIIGGIIGTSKMPKKAIAGLGFASSIVAGVLILINGLEWFMLRYLYMPIPFGFVLGGLAVISGVVVIIGAILSYMLRKLRTGSILVIAFSLIGTTSGGGSFFSIGLLLGIIGGIVSLTGK